MRFYHRTDHGTAILAGGFRDANGSWGMDATLTGVWVSTTPLDLNEGAGGDDLLIVCAPEADIIEWEVVEEGKPYREFLVPADILNRYPVRRATEEDD